VMPSVTIGIDAAVTANTNACNTATRELTPHLIFQGPSFWSPQNPHPETTRTIFQRPRVDAVLPPALVNEFDHPCIRPRAIGNHGPMPARRHADRVPVR
jgi:hypothetical protein